MSLVRRVGAALVTAVSSLALAASCDSERDVAISRTGDGADSSADWVDSSTNDSSADRADSSVSLRDATGEEGSGYIRRRSMRVSVPWQR